MPVRIKIFVSILAALVVGGFAFMQLSGPRPEIGYVGLTLAALMVLAIWMFPETGKVNTPSKN